MSADKFDTAAVAVKAVDAAHEQKESGLVLLVAQIMVSIVVVTPEFLRKILSHGPISSLPPSL
jgi:hypothetical protein